MKKIINKPENVVTEMLDGLAYVHSVLVHRVEGFDIIARNEPNSQDEFEVLDKIFGYKG